MESQPARKPNSLAGAIALLAVVLALCAALWAVTHRFDYEHTGGALVRVDRFTGSAEVLRTRGWERLGR